MKWAVNHLLPAQYEFMRVQHRAPTDFAAYVGGVGSGKSWIGTHRAAILGSHLFPRSKILVGALSNTLLEDTTYRIWEEQIPPEIWCKKDRARAWLGCPDERTMINGTKVFWRHLRDRKRIQSTWFNIIHIEEASQISRAVFQMLVARCRHKDFALNPSIPGLVRRTYIMLTTNPEEESGWIDDLFISPNSKVIEGRRKLLAADGLDPDITNWRYINAPTRQNIHLPHGYVGNLESMGDQDWCRVYVEGVTGGLRSGKPYRNWDRAINGEQAAPYGCRFQEGHRTWVSFDFNVEPGVCVIGQEHSDAARHPQRLAEWDEVCAEVFIPTRSCTELVAERACEILGSHRIRSVKITGDQGGAKRDTRSKPWEYRTDWAIIEEVFKRKGIGTEFVKSPNPPERQRVDSVCGVLRNGAGQTRGWINTQTCPMLVRDLERVTWKAGTSHIDKDTSDPDKRMLTHLSDALGYRWHQRYPVIGRMYQAA